MFMLFTTPALPQGGMKEGASTVIGAIREGADKSGADFSYLVKTARQESSLDPTAKAIRSSATGLFQFVEQTWLKTLKESGPALGLGRYADAVVETKQGKFDVPDPQMRTEILKLRSDPKIASLMAGALTKANAASLSGALGRKPDAADLYMAHVLGANGAAGLLRKSETEPDFAASTLLPDAAKSNPALFYDPVSGRAKSVGDVRDLLTKLHARAADGPLPAAKGSDGEDNHPLAPLAYAHPDGPALFSLYRNIGTITPLNPVVGALWTEPETFSSDHPSYFPRSDQMLKGASVIPQTQAIATKLSKPLHLKHASKPESADD